MSIAYNARLDGLRAIAVFIVMAAHAGSPYLRSGGVGVDIFFVLSGYLITSILTAESESSGAISFQNFYIRRLLRLAPCLVMVVIFFGISTYLMQHELPWKHALIALTYTANWSNALYGNQLGAVDHCWSLATEEQYYLIWPFVVSALEKTGRRASEKGLLLLMLALLFALYRFSMVGGFSPERIYYGLDTHIDGLVLGSSLSYLLKTGYLSKTDHARAIARYALPPCVIALGLMPHFLTWHDALMGKFGLAATAIMAAVVITTLVAGGDLLITRPLRTAPLVFIGKISYGLYLWHLPIYAVVNALLPHARFRLIFPIKIAVTVAIACASYYLVERRFLKLKRLFSNSVRQIPGNDTVLAGPAVTTVKP